MPEDSPERLLFTGYRYLKRQDMDSAKYFKNRLMDYCDKMLAEKFDENIVMYKVRAKYVFESEEEGKKYLADVVAKHPNTEFLQFFKEGWDATGEFGGSMVSETSDIIWYDTIVEVEEIVEDANSDDLGLPVVEEIHDDSREGSRNVFFR